MPETAAPFSSSSLMSVTPRPDLVFVRGEGAYLYDRQGRRYLDWVQGWAVNCLGHAPPAVVQALCRQAGTLINPSPAFYNEPAMELATLLTQHSCFDQVFFANSGAEANEGAIKLARKWGQLHKPGAFEIITFVSGFHGRTLATMSASGKPGWDTMFAPQVPGFPKAQWNDLSSPRALISAQTVAIMLEPVQGEAGVMPADPAFLQGLRELCDTHGLLLALELGHDRATQVVTLAREQHGLLLNAPREHCLRFMPALNSTTQEVEQGLTLLREVLRELDLPVACGGRLQT